MDFRVAAAIAVGLDALMGAVETHGALPRGPRAPSRPRRAELPVDEPDFDIAAARAEAPARPLAEPREEVAEVRDVDADGVPCRLYRPGGRPTGWSSTCTAAASSSTTSTCTTPSRAGWPTAAACAVLSVDYRRPPEHRFPAAPDDVDTVVALARPRGAGHGLGGPTYVHGDSAGGNLALVAALRHPGRFRAVALVYPFLDPSAGFESYRTARRRLRPARGGVVLAAVRRAPRRPRPPRPRAAALRPARHAAADAGRHRRARPAARRGRAARAAARRGGRGGRRRPATSGRCTASGGTRRCSPPPSR